MLRFGSASSVLIASLSIAYPASAADPLQVGDASITQNQSAGTWTIAAGGSSLTLALGPSHDFNVVSLTTASGKNWALGIAPGTFVQVLNQSLPLGWHNFGFDYQGVTTSANGQSLRLDATFLLPTPGLRLTRHYTVTSGSPAIEAWTSYTALPAAGVQVTDLNAFQLTVPNGTIHWVNGLQGDSADTIVDSAFSLQQQLLDPGQHLSLGSPGRSSQATVPWFTIDGTQDEFFAALMWSGSWSLDAERTGPNLLLTLGLAPMTTGVSTTTLDGPHAIFGVVPGGTAGAATALQSYVLGAIRNGRPFTPLVTYNTWFAYGTGVDVATMTAEMDRVAALGTELFVVDAGWYVGAGGSGLFDYESGLGNYAPDSDRFPNGLKPLTDHAHGLGMKFGIWVEPEHVNLSTVGAPGVDESWLATIGGDYGSDTVGQLCFASDAARQWVLNQLTSLIDAAQPDYLKWDNNNWINCDRPGHGHGTTDGNFAHVNGLYDLLASLRDRYPNLLVENVSGGGNRLDAGWLRYSDVAWMDDRTAPSVHVRHSIEGLSALFPPAYLLSFVTDHAGEPIQDAPDLPLYFRSRMEGVLGLCFLSAELSDSDAAAIAAQIAIYKNIRDTLGTSAGTLLTAQAAATDGPAWDVLQEASSDGEQILVQAFQSDDSVDTINVKPQGLNPQTTYNVSSVDTGFLGSSTGADLTNDGIDIIQSSTSAAHLLVIVAQ